MNEFLPSQGPEFDPSAEARLRQDVRYALVDSGAVHGALKNVLRRGLFKASVFFVSLSLLFQACGGGPGATVEAPNPGNGGEEANATQPIDVGPTAESISTEEPFVPYAAGGELSEAQVSFLESSRGRDQVKIFGLWGDKWIKDGVFGAGTTLSLLPMEDQTDPNNIDKMTLVGRVNAPGDDSYEGFFITPPVDMMDLYLHGDPARGIEPGDINQLQPPEDKVLEPFKMSRVVEEGSAPARAGIPVDAILQFKDQRFVYMFGSVGNLQQVGVINEANQWEASEEQVDSEVESPYSEDEMKAISDASYTWDASTQTMEFKGEKVFWKNEENKWVVSEEDLGSDELPDVNYTNGIDSEGNPIVAMFTRTVQKEGLSELQAFGPLSKEWFVPADILASQELMDLNLANDLNEGNWGDFGHITFEDIPVVTQEFANSHKLFESQLLFLREWPENVRVPKLQCIKEDIFGNYWQLSQYPMGTAPSHYMGNIYYESQPGERPIVDTNNGVNQNLSAIRYFDEASGKWVIEQGIQYLVGGHTVVLSVRHTGARANPNDPEFINTQQFLTNPAYLVVEPRCSGAEVRLLMPPELQDKMKELDSNSLVPSREAGYYPVGLETMVRLQSLKFEGDESYSFEKSMLEAYLREEADPIFEELFPDRLKN